MLMAVLQLGYGKMIYRKGIGYENIRTERKVMRNGYQEKGHATVELFNILENKPLILYPFHIFSL